MTRRTAAGAALAAALLTISTGTAHADATSMNPASTGTAPPVTMPSQSSQLQAAAAEDCKLITDLQPVVTDLLATVNGSATTPGSVAWLNAGAAKARAAGRTNLATWLTQRATLRQEQGAVLTTRQQLMAEGVTWCQAHGFGASQ
ncbi:MAG TPA: hypothetical protein VFU73_06055 [Actinocrinis sp.]|nr:hypothetical protein [Actinocrinis sp.]